MNIRHLFISLPDLIHLLGNQKPLYHQKVASLPTRMLKCAVLGDVCMKVRLPSQISCERGTALVRLTHHHTPAIIAVSPLSIMCPYRNFSCFSYLIDIGRRGLQRR
jgi:hypothetical protein